MCARRVVIIGLDGLEPTLAFDRFRDDLPNLGRLMDDGLWGPLASCVPPITIPAWSCLFSGRDPGELGCYGFRNRLDYSYSPLGLASSADITVPRLWELAGQGGLTSLVLGVPQTFPATPMKGLMVAGFPCVGDSPRLCFPTELRSELDALAGPDGYLVDGPGHRQVSRQQLIVDQAAVTRQRFAVARQLMATRAWDLAVLVDMAADRAHHAAWPAGDDFSTLAGVYRQLDDELGQVVDQLRPDDVVVVVSDHGARRLEGGFAINEWLRREGELVLHSTPRRPTLLTADMVDWTRTRAWGEGGYYGRIFCNVAGREPQGVIPAAELGAYTADLVSRLEALAGNRVLVPRTVYRQINRIPPDLILLPGDLALRALGTVGGGVLQAGNDTGPDAANHSAHGVLVLRDGISRGHREGLDILDVLPTVLDRLGLPIPPTCHGRVLQ